MGFFKSASVRRVVHRWVASVVRQIIFRILQADKPATTFKSVRSRSKLLCLLLKKQFERHLQRAATIG